MMNFEIRHRSAVLAPPAVPLQYSSAEFVVFAVAQPYRQFLLR
jgi:hypothetical protein